jgi:hypothetical protein
MPIYVIERNFAEQLQPSKELAEQINAVNADAGDRWIFSFLTADKKKTYCLYEAPNPDAILEAARRLGIPADVIVEVDKLNPDGLLASI